MECKWLPELVPCKDWNNVKEYERILYHIFYNDFIVSHPLFERKPVSVRKEPKVDGMEQAFFHITTCEYIAGHERNLDARRCERIRWVRAFIENCNCNPAFCEDCDGIKVWEEPYKMYVRVKLLFEEEAYMVILERRATYVLLITAYYMDYPNTLRKQIKQYRAFSKASRASTGETQPETPSATGR